MSKKKNISKYISEDLEVSFDDSDEEASHESEKEFSDESDEKDFVKESIKTKYEDRDFWVLM